VVLDEVAILTRPGAASRRGEVATVADALQPFRALHAIQAPGTLDGGDVLRLGRNVFVGLSSRSNAEGIEQLRALIEPLGYQLRAVPIHDCLHLKSAVTAVSDDAVLLQPRWVERSHFDAWRIIEVAPQEPDAANVLRLGGHCVMPSSFPRTAERLLAAGVQLSCIDLSELQKAEGATTCCSVVFKHAG
jgi:dimethylargininase